MIKPICDKCKKELDQFGAILWSPPMKRFVGDKEVLQKIKEYSTGRNNPRATFVKVVDKNNNELFRGIRKEVEEWCENKGICSIGSIKILLYKNLPFHPNYKTKRFLNSKQYDGIRFQYV